MKESDIRPEALLQRYLELSAADAGRCFAGAKRSDIACVGCGGRNLRPEFEKSGFGYSSCWDCGTLFQTPRPSPAAFEELYRDSVSSRFWAEEFFPAVAEARRERIFKPRAEQLRALCRERGLRVDCLVDVGAGYGIMLEEWRRIQPETRLLAIEPSATLAAECRRKGLEVVEDIAENAGEPTPGADLVVCFEVLEHVYDPPAFLGALRRLARPGGCVVVSTLGVDGFDIQMLWERSNSVFPPHHINFLSTKGFRELFGRAGLSDVQISTPGALDVDIVRNAANKVPGMLDGHRFIRRLLDDESNSAAFQAFLAANGLSSHVWVMGRTPAHA